MHDPRSRNRIVRIAAVALALRFLGSVVSAQTFWNVDDDNCPGPGDGSIGNPFCSIQAAINAAINGDFVTVAPGTYFENINFLGKSITVRSQFGPQVTTIDGGAVDSVVYFNNGEGVSSRLRGFTITGGSASLGGGLRIQSASPGIVNCIFIANTAVLGGVAYILAGNPTLANCEFIQNDAFSGGALYIKDAAPTIVNGRFSGNCSDGGDGGAIFNNNSATAVINCTFNANDTTVSGGAMFSNNGSAATVYNSIFWGNSPDEIVDNATATTIYNCVVQGGWGGAGLNIFTGDPLFIDVDGMDNVAGNADDNLRPDPDSSSADSVGSSLTLPPDTADIDNDGDTVETIELDLDGVRRIVGSLDAGAYEITCLICLDTNPGDCVVTNLNTGLSYACIQSAIIEAVDGDEIVATEGQYFGTIDFLGKAVTVRSTDPTDPAVVAATILDGLAANHTVVQCISGEGPGTVLSGFRIRRGDTDLGAAIKLLNSDLTISHCFIELNEASSNGGGVYAENSMLSMSDCTIRDNITTIDGGAGLFMSGGNATITDCTFESNITAFGGGAMFIIDCNPTLTGCTFLTNTAGHNGGAIFNIDAHMTMTDCHFEGNVANFSHGGAIASGGSDTIISDCTFLDNVAVSHGGAIWSVYSGISFQPSNPIITDCSFVGNAGATATSSGAGGAFFGAGGITTIDRCLFTGNSIGNPGALGDGGALYMMGLDSTISNSVICFNDATSDAGGLGVSENSITLVNTTISGNTAVTSGGGLNLDGAVDAVVVNSILWNNTAPEIDGTFNSLSVTWSDIQGGHAGVGNIDVDPIFVDPDGIDNIAGTDDDDFRLQGGSLCIDAGDSMAPALVGLTEDLDGTPRILDDPSTGDTGIPDVIGRVIDLGAYEYRRPCPADTNGDGFVNVTDLLSLLAAWGSCGSPCFPDINGDSQVNVTDLLALLAAWGACP